MMICNELSNERIALGQAVDATRRASTMQARPSNARVAESRVRVALELGAKFEAKDGFLRFVSRVETYK